MHCVFTLKFAVFLLFEAFGRIPLFLHRRVVAPLALRTLENHQFTHFLFYLSVGYDTSRSASADGSGS